jgi:hypothetical protein
MLPLAIHVPFHATVMSCFEFEINSNLLEWMKKFVIEM